VQARLPYSILNDLAGGGPNVSNFDRRGPAYMVTFSSLSLLHILTKKSESMIDRCNRSVSIALQAAG
jgi:hypothetical protein